MALEAWQYGDPETVAIRKQETDIRRREYLAKQHEQCGQCAYRKVTEYRGRAQIRCDRGHDYGTRCRHYKVAP